MGAFIVGIMFGIVATVFFNRIRAERARKSTIAPRR